MLADFPVTEYDFMWFLKWFHKIQNPYEVIGISSDFKAIAIEVVFTKSIVKNGMDIVHDNPLPLIDMY